MSWEPEWKKKQRKIDEYWAKPEEERNKIIRKHLCDLMVSQAISETKFNNKWRKKYEDDPSSK